MPAGGRPQGAARTDSGAQPRREIAPPDLLLQQRGLANSTRPPVQPLSAPPQEATSGTPRERRRPGGLHEAQGATQWQLKTAPGLLLSLLLWSRAVQEGAHLVARGSGAQGLLRGAGPAGRGPKRKEAGSSVGGGAGMSSGGSAGGGGVGIAGGAAKGSLEEAGASVRDLMRMRRLRRRLGSGRPGEGAPGGGQQAEPGGPGRDSGVPGRESARGSSVDRGASGRGPARAPPANVSLSRAVAGRGPAEAALANLQVSASNGPSAPGGVGGAGGVRQSWGGRGGGLQRVGQGAGAGAAGNTGVVGPESPHTLSTLTPNLTPAPPPL